jgi:MYXO-CTERM domain-containing protein
MRFSGAGDPYGGPEVLWSRTYASAALASEGATALVLDENQDLLVGGWAIDLATGLERWRIAKLDTAYGDEVQEWLGAVRGGNSRLNGLAVRDGRVAMAGFVDDGKGEAADYATTFLDFDLDEDGVADVVDACPSDPEKSLDSGVCGCGIPDNDTDLDGVLNCLEECDSDPTKTEPIQCPNCDDDESDPDGDGVANCIDDCDDDPDKTAPGVCGCGAPDSDSDGDGVLGCDDACSNTPPGTDVDEFGCPLPVDTGTPGTTTATDGADDKGGGCGCAGAPRAPGGALALALALGVLLVRRRAQL